MVSKDCRDIHVRINSAGNMLIDFRNDKGVITDIHEYETTNGFSRSGINTIIQALAGSDYAMRKVR